MMQSISAIRARITLGKFTKQCINVALRLPLLSALSLSLMSFSAAYGFDISLEFKSEDFQCRNPSVYLSDILECQGPSRHCDEVASVWLMDCPQPLSKVRISSAEVTGLISQEFPDLIVVWTDEGHLNLQSEYVRVSEDLIIEELNRQVASILSGHNEFKTEVLRAKVYDTLVLRGHTWKLNLEDAFQNAVWLHNKLMHIGSSWLSLHFVLENDFGDQKKAKALVQFSSKMRLPAAARSLPRDHVIVAADLVDKWSKVRFGNKSIATAVEEIVGMRLKRPIDRGESFNPRYLDRLRLVAVGEDVSAVIEQGGLQMESTLRALQHGGMDDKIRVEDRHTKRKMKAQIIGRSKVRVQL